MKKLFTNFANIGLDETVINEEIVRIRILNVLCAVAILAILFLYCLRDILFHRYDVALFHFHLVFIFIPPLIFNRVKKFRAARYYLFGLFPLSLIASNYYLSDIGAENYLFGMVLLSFLIFDKTHTKFIASSYCALIFIMSKYIIRNKLGLNLHAESGDELFYFNTSQSFIVVTICSFIYSYQNKMHHLKLELANTKLRENTVLIESLLKELNHRVKNNLQMISSLFNIQSSGSELPEVKAKLGEAMSRVQALSLVYEKLHNKKVYSEINLNEYIHEQINFLIGNFFQDNIIQTKTEVPPDILLGPEETIHIGLIINELVTNIHKYGLGQQGNKLALAISRIDNGLKIRIADNGKGFPVNFNPMNSGNFGFELVHILVQKYDGTLTTFNEGGAVVEITLKLAEITSAAKPLLVMTSN